MKISTILVVTSFLAAGGCQRRDSAPSTPEPARPTERMGPVGAGAPAPTAVTPPASPTIANPSLNQVLGYLHTLNQQQGEIASLGVQKGSTLAMQAYARGLASSHQGNDTRLLTLASNERILLPGVTLPTNAPESAHPGAPAPPPASSQQPAQADLGALAPWVDVATHQTLLAKLQALSGTAFDEAFLAAAAQSYDAAWNHVREVQALFTDPDVVSFLGDTMKDLHSQRDDAMARRARRGAAL